jgi:nicotinic acid mononucleotide adenylyltransferase
MSIPITDISSTQIRDWIKKYTKDGIELAAPYMNRKALDYITEHGLYRPGEKEWLQKEI